MQNSLKGTMLENLRSEMPKNRGRTQITVTVTEVGITTVVSDGYFKGFILFINFIKSLLLYYRSII
jgi:hypothetical protein